MWFLLKPECVNVYRHDNTTPVNIRLRDFIWISEHMVALIAPLNSPVQNPFISSNSILFGCRDYIYMQWTESPSVKGHDNLSLWSSARTQQLRTMYRHVCKKTMFILVCQYNTDSVITYAAAITASSSPAQPGTAVIHGSNPQWQRQARLWVGDEAGGWPQASPKLLSVTLFHCGAGGASSGDERICLSVCLSAGELAERIKWIWLRLWWAELVNHLNVAAVLQLKSRRMRRDHLTLSRCPKWSCNVESTSGPERQNRCCIHRTHMDECGRATEHVRHDNFQSSFCHQVVFWLLFYLIL